MRSITAGSEEPSATGTAANQLAHLAFVIAFASVGGLVAALRPHHPVGWLLLASALCYSIGGLGVGVAVIAQIPVWLLLNPARRRIQGWVDRRFDRQRYSAARIADGFGARLRDRLDLDAVQAELTLAAASALRPTASEIWLRPRTGR